MKQIKKLTPILFLSLLTLILYGWNTTENKLDMDLKQSVIVLLNFKAQPEKGAKAVSELKTLLEKVKAEPNFVSIKLHIDPKDDTNILLYEEWEDVSYYNSEHMNTPYINEFMANSQDFLAGPPEITFWEVANIYK